MSINNYFWPIIDNIKLLSLSPLAREGRSGFFLFCYKSVLALSVLEICAALELIRLAVETIKCLIIHCV